MLKRIIHAMQLTEDSIRAYITWGGDCSHGAKLAAATSWLTDCWNIIMGGFVLWFI